MTGPFSQQGGADGARDVFFSGPRSGQEFAAEWGDEPGNRVRHRRSVLDAPLPVLPIAIHDDSPIFASGPWVC